MTREERAVDRVRVQPLPRGHRDEGVVVVRRQRGGDTGSRGRPTRFVRKPRRCRRRGRAGPAPRPNGQARPPMRRAPRTAARSSTRPRRAGARRPPARSARSSTPRRSRRLARAGRGRRRSRGRSPTTAGGLPRAAGRSRRHPGACDHGQGEVAAHHDRQAGPGAERTSCSPAPGARSSGRSEAAAPSGPGGRLLRTGPGRGHPKPLTVPLARRGDHPSWATGLRESPVGLDRLGRDALTGVAWTIVPIVLAAYALLLGEGR